MNKIKAIAVSLVFFTLIACGESKEISMVKGGSFIKMCSDVTIEQMVDAYLEKPKWKQTTDKNGIDYVDVSGVTANGKPANVFMQFWIRNDEFGIQTLEIDGEVIEGSNVLMAMCRLAYQEKAKAEAEKVRTIPAESLTDSRDGKKYKTVKIGEQVWMAENLNVETAGKSVCYKNKESNCKKYGRLYGWNTALKACPSGWHLPTAVEWEALVNFVGGKEIAGKRLKAKSGWNDNKGKSGNGIDNYGFAALPGGEGNSDGSFESVGDKGYWWSADEAEYDKEFRDLRAYLMGLIYDTESVFYGIIIKSKLLSVRCIKDTGTEKKSVKKEEKEDKKKEQSDESFDFDCSKGRARSSAEKAMCAGVDVSEFEQEAVNRGPSFDCAKASTPSEKAICSNDNLAELDNRLAEAYKKARSACKTDVKKEQKEWLKNMSSCTSNVKCLEDSYKSRIQELENCR